MPPPQAILCHLCNGKYFKRSYPIHLKQCEAKWKKTHSRCEYCGAAVSNHDWSDHRSHCKPSKRNKKSAHTHSKNMPLTVPTSDHQQLIPTLANKDDIRECEECETENAVWKCVECEQSLCAMCEVDLHRKGARSRHVRIPINAKALRQENMSILTENECKETQLNPPKREPNQDGRVQCKFCSRRFNPERAEKHMRICSKAQKKAKKRRIYDGAKKRVEGTVFEEFQYNRSKTPEKVKEWKKNSRRWKEESAQLRDIAAINSDLKEIKDNNTDKKDEESDIIIKAPANKPVFRKTVSSTTKSDVSSSKSRMTKKKNLPLQGSSMKMRERPLSNTSNISSKGSLKGSSRRNIKRNLKNKTVNKKETSKNISNNDRLKRRNSIPKKPSIPKFERKKTTPNITTKPMKSKIVEKENNSKRQQPIFRRTKSEANSLPRGIDLGVNVNKMFNDAPKTMNDYVERERLRRQNRRKKSNVSKKSLNNESKSKVVIQPKVPTKRMSRLQIKKEIKIENQAIGGKRANKPSDSKDLASKRAAYFESLLQNQE